MLPFLKKSQEAGASGPAETVMREPDMEEEPTEDFDSLHVAAQDMLDAIHSKDAKALALAIQAAFDMCESNPFEET